MNKQKLLNSLLAFTIGVSMIACQPSTPPTGTEKPTSTQPTSTQPTLTQPTSTELMNESKEVLANLEDAEMAMDAAEEDTSADAAFTTSGLKIAQLKDTLVGAKPIASLENAPRLKRAINKTKSRIRAAAVKVQNYLKENFERSVIKEQKDNGDGTITQVVERTFKVKKNGAQKKVITERTFVIETGDPKKIYHKYELTLPNGATRVAERTVIFNEDGSRSSTFKSTLTLANKKTQTINMSGTIDKDGNETRTGEMTLINGKKVTIKTEIKSDGSATRKVEADGIKVELVSPVDGKRTVTTTDTTTNKVVETAPVSDVATESVTSAESEGRTTEIVPTTTTPTTT